jgi:hypothetical protein
MGKKILVQRSPYMIQKPNLIEFNKIGNPSLGYISVAEESKLPFQIKRVYWTYFTPQDVIRGGHAHKNLRQIVFAVSGIIKFNIETIDGVKMDFTLDKPNVGLYIGKMSWREIHFSHNAVLLCLASDEFIESDYIRVYEEFRKLQITSQSF